MTSRVISWITGLVVFVKARGSAGPAARPGLVIAPLLLHSGPWVLVIAVAGVFYASTSANATHLWVVVGGLALAIAFVAWGTLRAFLRHQQPSSEAPPLTPERFLALRRRFFWRNSFAFAVIMPAVLFFQSSLSFGRNVGLLVFAFILSFGGGWLWSWFMWQWYGEALKVNEKRRQARKGQDAL